MAKKTPRLSAEAIKIKNGIESVLQKSEIDSLAFQRGVNSSDAVALRDYFNSMKGQYCAEVGQEVGSSNHDIYVRRLS